MQISVITLFPQLFQKNFSISIIGRAQKKKLLTVNPVDLRDFATDRHRSVDDRPYGGGVGMILRVDVIDRALVWLKRKSSFPKNKSRTVLLDPKGKLYSQNTAATYSKFDHLILICGHYEGVDERVKDLVDESISVGNYILTGGEIPAMVIIDSVGRLCNGVLPKDALNHESFKKKSYLEYPQYTRPAVYKKKSVPKVLISGNHKEILKWQTENSL